MKGLRPAVLGVASITLMGLAAGQEPFPDIPENRRVYAILERLQEKGILVGYQFGPEGGPWSKQSNARHVVATAIHSAYTKVNFMVAELQTEIDVVKSDLRAVIGEAGLPLGCSQQEYWHSVLQELKVRLDHVADTLEPEIRPLISLTYAFEADLLALGVDLDEMRCGLYDTLARVSPLHKAVTHSARSNPKVGAKVKPRARRVA